MSERSTSGSSPANDDSYSDVRVGMVDVIRFVRQLSHDLRNQLNAAELQSAFLKEIAEDGEVKDEIQRLRGMLSEAAVSLQRLTTSLAPAKLTDMPYEATAFLEDLRQKVAAQFADKNTEIEWDLTGTRGTVNIDPQILQQAMIELVGNAFQHGRGEGPIRISATANGELTVKISEPKTEFSDSTEYWGREPFRRVKHGHYGLGLLRARRIIEAHGGRLDARHDPTAAALITTVVLPLVAES